MSQNFPHSCQDDHELIGWSGDDELCPVCQLRVEREQLIRPFSVLLRSIPSDAENVLIVSQHFGGPDFVVGVMTPEHWRALAAAGKEKGNNESE